MFDWTIRMCRIGENRVGRIATFLALAMLLMLCLPAGQSWARSIDLVFDDETSRIGGYRFDGVDYVSLLELLHTLGALTDFDSSAQRLRVELDGRIWVFWGESAMVGIEGEAASLGMPVRAVEGDLAVPADGIARLLDRFSGMRVVSQGSSLRIQNRESTIWGYRIEQRSNGILIDLNVSSIPPYESFLSEGNWINITLQRTHLNSSRLNARNPHRTVRAVEAVQFDSSAQVSFRMRAPIDKYLIVAGESPSRLTILIGDTSMIWESGAVTEPPRLTSANDNPIVVIVIDPGHGGPDFGAVGPEKELLEKDVALAIAQRIADLLERDRRFQVVMTREDDRAVTLEERAEIANEAQGDLLISIHSGSDGHDLSHGSRTYFLGDPVSPDARRCATLENSAFGIDDKTAAVDGAGAPVPPEIRRVFQQSSADLAERMQHAFESQLDVPSRGADQTDLLILAAVDMPSVLIQPASISDEREEELLSKRSFQKRIAEAVYKSILSYKREREGTP